MMTVYHLLVLLLAYITCLTNVACECLNNYEYDGGRSSEEWNDNSVFKTKGVIKPAFEGNLIDWQLQIEFTAPLVKDLETWVVEGNDETAGKTLITLKPKSYNKAINKDNFHIAYIAAFGESQGDSHLKCVQFCGKIEGTDKELCPLATQPPIPVGSKVPSKQDLNCNELVKIREEWDRGYNGQFRFKVPVTVKDWTIIFTADKQFLNINPWSAKWKFISPNKYILWNRPHNGKQRGGDILEVGFGANFEVGQKPRILSVKLTSLSMASSLLLCGSSTKTVTSLPTILPGITSTTTNHPVLTTTLTEVTTTITNKPVSARTTDGATTTNNPLECTPKYNYSEVLEKSLLFYEAQRSGKLPSNKRVKWRKDSALNDGKDVGEDLAGGYYDAGDYVKFGFPMASAITNLAWGMIEFKEGYVKSKQYQYGIEALKWGTDYFIKCHRSKNTFYGQVGDGNADHASWGRPEDMTMQRPSQKIDERSPGSELAGETAAALAATSIVFSNHGDEEYAQTLLNHAEGLYNFADKNRGNYHKSIPGAANFYRSYSGYIDELAWASLWLYKASGKEKYKSEFLRKYEDKALTQYISEFSWDNKWAGVGVLAARLVITKKDYLKNFKTFITTDKKTPKGLFFVQKWGPNRHAANIAFLSLIAYKVNNDKFYEIFAREQIHYMLGDSGRSYVVGFGNNPPQRPHHRSSSCPETGACSWNDLNSAGPNPHVLYGALVGGPDANDNYVDDRKDYIKNEVAMDYNAGFQSAIAGLVQFATIGKC